MANEGFSRVLSNRRFEDYRSLKQFYSNRQIDEVIISGHVTTNGGAAEINLAEGDTINYIGAEGQVYIRTELDDIANQASKYVYIEYQDDTGAIKTIVTGDLDPTNSTTEVIMTGASDFYRLRQMISEVEATATKGIVLTDANMGGADDIFGFINDGNSQFNLQRFFVQPSATAKSFLARIKATAATTHTDATQDSFFLEITFTPKVVNLGEAQVAADKTIHLEFNELLDWQPCIELEPATEVIIKVGDNGDAGIISLEAIMVEVYGG